MKPAPWICPGCDSSWANAGPELGRYIAVPDNPDLVYPYAICQVCVSTVTNCGRGALKELFAEAAERVLRDPQRYGTAAVDRSTGVFPLDEMHPVLVGALDWGFKRVR